MRTIRPTLLASLLALGGCAGDEQSPFDPNADSKNPSLVSFEITEQDDRYYAAWQADEPVLAVVEYSGPGDGTVRHSYPSTRGFAQAGSIKLLPLVAGATYDDVFVRLRDRAGNDTTLAPPTAAFTTDAVVQDPLFLFAMIDVGWGDALYLEAPDGTNCLIDAGHPFDGLRVRAFLENYVQVDRLDFASMTHVHEDHIGGFYGDDFDGLDGLFRINAAGSANDPIPVGTFLDIADKTPGTVGGPYADLEQALAALGGDLGQHVKLHAGASSETEAALRWGAGVRVDLLAAGRKDFLLPEFILQAEAGSVQNNDSMVYRVQFGDFVMILAGDAEFASEQYLENHYPPEFLRAHVLKLGHHGSNDANSERFLEIVDPVVAMITNAVSENPGVEHPYVLGRLRKRGTDYFASDRVIPNLDRAEPGVRGDVLVFTDGSAFTVVVDNIVHE